MTMMDTCPRVSLMLVLLLLGTNMLLLMLLNGFSILFFTSGRSSFLMLLGLLGTGPGPGNEHSELVADLQFYD